MNAFTALAIRRTTGTLPFAFWRPWAQLAHPSAWLAEPRTGAGGAGGNGSCADRLLDHRPSVTIKLIPSRTVRRVMAQSPDRWSWRPFPSASGATFPERGVAGAANVCGSWRDPTDKIKLPG